MRTTYCFGQNHADINDLDRENTARIMSSLVPRLPTRGRGGGGGGESLETAVDDPYLYLWALLHLLCLGDGVGDHHSLQV